MYLGSAVSGSAFLMTALLEPLKRLVNITITYAPLAPSRAYGARSVVTVAGR